MEKIPIPKIKRLFDALFSSIILICASPLFLTIMLGLWLQNIISGNIFLRLIYTETRISQGEPFVLFKFNIFNSKAIEIFKASNGTMHSKEIENNTNNLSPIGKIIKKIYLDELPQFFNILKGDLSFVGPRPVHVSIYKKRLLKGDFTKAVIKAGITGNFQSQKGLTDKTDIELDQEYIDFCKNNPDWKIALNDIKIILKTLRVILKAKGI